MKFRLVERLGLNNITSDYLRKEAIKLIHGQNTSPSLDMKGQTSLLKFLCQNQGIPSTDNLCVHHIDFNHNNYDRANLCILTRSDHSYLHNGFMPFILNDVLTTQKSQDKAYKNKKHITTSDIDSWFDFNYFEIVYRDSYDDFIEKKRLDK